MQIFVNSFFTFYSNKVGPDFSKIKIKSFKDVVEVEVERKKSQILCLLTGVQQCLLHSWPLRQLVTYYRKGSRQTAVGLGRGLAFVNVN